MNILYPSLAMMGLTFYCIARLGYLRFVAVRDGTVDLRYFRVYEGYEETEQLRIHSRHVTNLFESPVLFYVISLIAFVTETASTLAIILAWSYVTFRFVHSYIHLTTNTVLLRFRFFAFSVVAMVILWVTVIIGLLSK